MNTHVTRLLWSCAVVVGTLGCGVTAVALDEANGASEESKHALEQSLSRSACAVLGSLPTGDEATVKDIKPPNTGQRYAAYRFSGLAGERVDIRVSSTQDAVAWLVNDTGFRVLASDDDSGGGLNARLQATLPATGGYLVVFRDYNDRPATFTLQRAKTAAAPTAGYAPGQVLPLAVGQWYEFSLQPEQPATYAYSYTYGKRFRLFRLEAQAGQAFTVTVDSSKDALAYLLDEQHIILAADDDGGGQGNARITYTPHRAGTYYVAIREFYLRKATFTLTLRRGISPAGVDPAVVLGEALGQVIDSANAAMLDELAVGTTLSGLQYSQPPRYRLMPFYGSWTRTATIQVQSDGDPIAWLLDSKKRVLAWDDDSGPGRGATVVYTLPYSGLYLIAYREKSASEATASIRVDLSGTSTGGGAGNNGPGSSSASGNGTPWCQSSGATCSSSADCCGALYCSYGGCQESSGSGIGDRCNVDRDCGTGSTSRFTHCANGYCQYD